MSITEIYLTSLISVDGYYTTAKIHNSTKQNKHVVITVAAHRTMARFGQIKKDYKTLTYKSGSPVFGPLNRF